jgi:hypothetical protein
VTKVEAGFGVVAGAAAAVAVAGDAVVPVDVEAAAVGLGGVEMGGVELAAVELAVALDDVVLAELSEPQPPRAARKETHTNPEHTLSAPNLKIIVTCPVAA